MVSKDDECSSFIPASKEENCCNSYNSENNHAKNLPEEKYQITQNELVTCALKTL